MLKIALVGCGGWAQEVHVPALLSRKDVQVVALSGVYDEEEGIELAEKYGLGQYVHSWEDLASWENIDAVIISTPHAFHYSQIKTFLNAGKHVHVDKPPAMKHAELKELLNLADSKNLFLSVHAQMKYAPGMTYLKKLLDEHYSDIYQVNAYIWQQLFDDFRGSWRSRPSLAGGGIMMDSGYHMIDSVHYLLRNKDLKNLHFLAHKGGRASDTVGLLSYSVGRTIVTISSVRGAPNGIQGQRIEIFGDGGYILFTIIKEDGKKYSKVTFNDNDGNVSTQFFEHTINFKADPLFIFLDAIINENIYAINELRTNDTISLDVVRVLEKAYN